MSGEEQAYKQTNMVCPYNGILSLKEQRMIKNQLEGLSLPAPTEHFVRILIYLLLICRSSCPIRTAAIGEADVHSGAQGSNRRAALLRRGKTTA